MKLLARPFIRRAARPLAAALCIAAGCAVEASAQTVSLPVTRTVVGGAGGWDYLEVEPMRQRLFLSRGNRVDVLDLASLRLVRSIDGTAGVHGVALAADRQLGFTSNGRAGSVTVFDLSSLQPLAEIADTGKNPDAIVYDKGTGRVFAFAGASGNAVVIDVASRQVIGTVALPGKPEFAVVDGRGNVFVNIEDRHSLVRIDAAAMAVTASYALTGCEEPTGLAIDPGHRRLFSVCANRVMTVVDPDAGVVVATVPIGSGPDAVVFDPGLGLVVSSNGEGTLSVVRQTDADHYAVAGTVTTEPGARTMALDAATHRLYVVTSSFMPAPASAASRRPVPVPGTFTVLTFDLSAWPRQSRPIQ